jgi:hypothetical protein
VSRRVSLPGADELFRTTGGTPLQASSPRRPAGEPRASGSAAEGDEPTGETPAGTDRSRQPPARIPARREPTGPEAGGEEHAVAETDDGTDPRGRTAERSANGVEQPLVRSGRRSEAAEDDGAGRGATGAAGASRRRGRAAARRPSGRERHDEKITVYVSAEELMDLEHARLVLRGEHGLAVDRGRIVREAVAVVLADLESRGEASILVRRLRGR